MKILLTNKYYYPRGGDCNYVIGLEKLLKNNGQEVAVFSMHHDDNLPNIWSEYWLSPIDFNSKNNLIEAILRPVYSKEVREKFTRIIDEFKPDVVHLNNIHSQISPRIAEIAQKRSIPVIWTLHDYKLLCPRYDCLRDDKPCELCFHNKFNVIKHNCIKNNYVGSSIGFFEALKWNKKKLSNITDYYICPSEFMKKKMIQGGFNESQFVKISNFFNGYTIETNPSEKENYYCYFGRLSHEKGVETLLKAAKELNGFKLKIIGTGPFENYLKNEYNFRNIEFLGFKKGDELRKLISKALFTVVPSEWYENNPLSIMESYSLGTPVIGANIGGIPEMIEDGVNGLLFQSGNVQGLMGRILYLNSNRDKCVQMGIEAIKYANTFYSASSHYSKLLTLYNNAINNKIRKSE